MTAETIRRYMRSHHQRLWTCKRTRVLHASSLDCAPDGAHTERCRGEFVWDILLSYEHVSFVVRCFIVDVEVSK
jgi:hypothetical protein